MVRGQGGNGRKDNEACKRSGYSEITIVLLMCYPGKSPFGRQEVGSKSTRVI